MLGNYWVAAQLAASQEGLIVMSDDEWLKTGFWLVIRFCESIIHTLQFITARTKPSQSAVSSPVIAWRRIPTLFNCCLAGNAINTIPLLFTGLCLATAAVQSPISRSSRSNSLHATIFSTTESSPYSPIQDLFEYHPLIYASSSKWSVSLRFFHGNFAHISPRCVLHVLPFSSSMIWSF
jgi:hypothetical protein